MFNKEYHTHQSSPSHVNHNVEIHRAPTDESVKLLNEMQEKALNNLICSGDFSDNKFDGRWNAFLEPMSGDVKILGIYSINGDERKINCNVRAYKLIGDSRDAIGQIIMKELHEAIKEDITDFVMRNFITSEFKKGDMSVFTRL